MPIVGDAREVMSSGDIARALRRIAALIDGIARYGRGQVALARRIACGPNRAPGRFETARSKGTPQTTASQPATSLL